MIKTKKTIRAIRRIPKNSSQKENFFNEFEKLDILGIVEGKLHKGLSVYRSRINKNNDSFTSIKQISYPPKPSNFFGRASSPGNQMFYGSYTPTDSGINQIKEAYVINAYEISLFLRDPKSSGNIKVTVGRWDVIKDINIAAIIFSPKFINQTLFVQNLNNQFNAQLQKHPEFSRNTRIWNKFIAEEFSKDVEEDKDFEYAISAFYSEFLISKGFDGIIYPSVKLDGRGINIAISKKAVDNKLNLYGVAEGRFYKSKKESVLFFETECIVKDPNSFKYLKVKDEI